MTDSLLERISRQYTVFTIRFDEKVYQQPAFGGDSNSVMKQFSTAIDISNVEKILINGGCDLFQRPIFLRSLEKVLKEGGDVKYVSNNPEVAKRLIELFSIYPQASVYELPPFLIGDWGKKHFAIVERKEMGEMLFIEMSHLYKMNMSAFSINKHNFPELRKSLEFYNNKFSELLKQSVKVI